MLVLARKPGQAVLLFIPGRESPLRVIFSELNDHGHPRLAIDAPDDVTILRDEVYEMMLDRSQRDGTPLTFDRSRR